MNDDSDSTFTFSILMANYNNSKYIEQAIDSVLNQDYPFWELIIVDDNSTDSSKDVIRTYLKNKKIKLIEHENNTGYGGALKTAASHANNEIIAILDADDKLDKTALKNMAETYKKNPEYGFMYSKMWICDSNLENCKINNEVGPIIPPKTSIFEPKISHFKTFSKKAYLKTPGFETQQKRSVDKDIIYKLEEVTNFKFINIPLYYYRKHPSGISQGKNIPLAQIYHYRAKCKTYRRRLKTNLPNFTLKQLYIEYFKITLSSQISLLKKIIKYFKKLLIIKVLKFFLKPIKSFF
ncbi:MAG: glycosyltransferase family 2 protein [Promethearchaeota archaeon]